MIMNIIPNITINQPPPSSENVNILNLCKCAQNTIDADDLTGIPMILNLYCGESFELILKNLKTKPNSIYIKFDKYIKYLEYDSESNVWKLMIPDSDTINYTPITYTYMMVKDGTYWYSGKINIRNNEYKTSNSNAIQLRLTQIETKVDNVLTLSTESNTKVNAALLRIDTTLDKIDSNTMRIDSLTDKSEQMNLSIDNINSKIMDLTQSIQSNEHQIDDIQISLNDASTMILTLNDSLSDEIARATNTERTLQNQISNIQITTDDAKSAKTNDWVIISNN